MVEKTFFPKSEASVRGVPAFIETDRFCRSSHHHHSSSSSLSRVRARARTNTLARDGSRASRRTRRRRAETGRDRTFGTGASSWVARSPVPSPPSRSWDEAAPSLFAHTTAFRWTRDSPLDPPQHERRPTPRAASASPRRDARAWARPSPRTSPQPVRYVRRSSGDAPSKTSSLNRNPRDAKKKASRCFFLGRRGKRFRRRRDDLRVRREKSEPLKTRTRTSADRVFSPFRLFFSTTPPFDSPRDASFPFDAKREKIKKTDGGGERAQVGLRRRVSRAGVG